MQLFKDLGTISSSLTATVAETSSLAQNTVGMLNDSVLDSRIRTVLNLEESIVLTTDHIQDYKSRIKLLRS